MLGSLAGCGRLRQERRLVIAHPLPLATTALEESAHETSEEQRGTLLREATAIVGAERPILPLYREKDLYAFSAALDYQPLPHQQFSTPLQRMRWKV